MDNSQPLPEPIEQVQLKESSRQSLLREWTIGIRFYSIGCVIEVGCKSIPFQSVEEAMAALNAYVANPSEEAARWMRILD